MRTWIVVCDASRARLFMKKDGAVEWVKFEEFEHPASRARAEDLVTDQQGRNSASSGRVGKTGTTTAPQTDPMEVEEQRFAHSIGEILNQAHAQGAFDQLVIVAAPNFLGLLRGELVSRVQKAIYATIDKNLSNLSDREIEERVALP